jgi:hypothetical protein
MEPGKILDILLEQHAQLRRLIARCELYAGEDRWDALDALRLALAAHQRCEERYLRWLLPATELARMAVEHVSESVALDTQDPAELAAALAGLRAHLASEEVFFLNEQMLDCGSRSNCSAN